MQCVKCDGNLVFMKDNVISVWQIPPLVSRSINPNPPIEVCRPLSRHLHRAPTETNDSVMVSQIGWRPNISSKAHPFHFDVLYDQTDGTTTLDHRILHPIDNDAGEGLPSCLPIFIGQTPTILSNFEDTRYERVAWISSSDVVYIWTQNSDIMVMLSTLPASTNLPNKQSMGIMWTSAFDLQPDAEICPFSGRACIMDRQLTDGSEIRVMDYLLPPSR